jgi:hypothetical protein
MPLDDVYIHFQYARQIAVGQPYIYNPGQPPSSGATSFLYPYLLAVGYLPGFQGLNLGLWAMIIGVLALIGATWLVYLSAQQFGSPPWMALCIAIIFEISGPVSWHFMSGMETGLVVLFTLALVYCVALSFQPTFTMTSSHLRATSIAAALLTLIRPEGAILALLAVGVTALRIRQTVSARKHNISVLFVPVIAIGIQPLVNLLLTGSAVASGNAAKSVLGIVPFYWDEVIRRIAENFGRIWLEFFTGISPREGMYFLPLFAVAGIIGLQLLVLKRQQRWLGLMLVVWLLAGTGAVATLDTAFWHFKRYQMPFMAIWFPLVAYALAKAVELAGKHFLLSARYWVGGFVFLALGTSLFTGAQFLHHYVLNVDYVYLQPLQMARWLQANTPLNAVVAVHDTGMMRYMSGRATIDMVGLTTPGAADYWRNGPGAVAEYLIQKRPDYIAAYGPGHGFGLGMIADTRIYGRPLASFPVDVDNNANVALAANFQGIYRPDWDMLRYKDYAAQSLQPYGNYFWAVSGSAPLAELNVGNLADEAAHHYHWRDNQRLPGFPTEVHEFDYVNCAVDRCHIADGGRLINGEESFDFGINFGTVRGSDLILVTRLHPSDAGTFDVYANDTFIGTRWIPAIPGKWLEVSTLIPADVLTKAAANTLHIRIVPHVPGGFYMPYYHWVYSKPVEAKPDNVIASFQSGAIVLTQATLDYQPGAAQLGVKLDWYSAGKGQGDYKVFVHLYKDPNQPPVAQIDMRPGNGTLPPGNWLPGVLHDTIMVDLNGVSAGKYRAAIGMYNPVTLERLAPMGGDDQQRLFIGDVEIR